MPVYYCNVYNKNHQNFNKEKFAFTIVRKGRDNNTSQLDSLTRPPPQTLLKKFYNCGVFALAGLFGRVSTGVVRHLGVAGQRPGRHELQAAKGAHNPTHRFRRRRRLWRRRSTVSPFSYYIR
jgi:hypothetical protein